MLPSLLQNQNQNLKIIRLRFVHTLCHNNWFTDGGFGSFFSFSFRSRLNHLCLSQYTDSGYHDYQESLALQSLTRYLHHHRYMLSYHYLQCLLILLNSRNIGCEKGKHVDVHLQHSDFPYSIFSNLWIFWCVGVVCVINFIISSSLGLFIDLEHQQRLQNFRWRFTSAAMAINLDYWSLMSHCGFLINWLWIFHSGVLWRKKAWLQEGIDGVIFTPDLQVLSQSEANDQTLKNLPSCNIVLSFNFTHGPCCLQACSFV